MNRNLVLPLSVALLALGCTEPYPSVGGTWEYVSTLTFPSDFDIAPGQPYTCTYRGALTLGQTSGLFGGTYDSLSIACNSGGGSSGNTGTVINGNLAKNGILSFYFDTPDWLSVGTLHGDSMGGIASDSVNGLPGRELATGTWSACRGRVCQ